jgi:hypothetical protein
MKASSKGKAVITGASSFLSPSCLHKGFDTGASFTTMNVSYTVIGTGNQEIAWNSGTSAHSCPSLKLFTSVGALGSST